mmetsp:Transcript_11265/g.25262  ORF Transcript_11265/g.25262 Transcript_11265/m.25262 type:complete len:81 (-) Transcript_11265:10-252(-)
MTRALMATTAVGWAQMRDLDATARATAALTGFAPAMQTRSSEQEGERRGLKKSPRCCPRADEFMARAPEFCSVIEVQYMH